MSLRAEMGLIPTSDDEGVKLRLVFISVDGDDDDGEVIAVHGRVYSTRALANDAAAAMLGAIAILGIKLRAPQTPLLAEMED